MKKAGFILLLSAFFVFNINPTQAAGSNYNYGGQEPCTPSYGANPCPQTSIAIDKTVQKPGKGGGEFVDNLTLNDPKFAANQDVTFKINVKNTGNSTLESIEVVDTLPQYMKLQNAGNDVDYNKDTNKLTYKVTLKAGDSAEKVIVARVTDVNSLPGTTCVINYVTATAKNGASATDSSQACIEKVGTTPEVLSAGPVKKSPATGPEMALPFLGMTGVLGYFLRKKAH